MSLITIDNCIELLNILSLPYYHQKSIEEEFSNNDSRYKQRIEQRFTVILHILSLFSSKIGKDQNELGKPHSINTNFQEVAKTCKIYFKQGAEMLSASKSIPETSSPLVEYYGYLQWVKGAVLSVMDLNTKFFLNNTE